MSETIINKVQESGIITLDLEKYLPEEEITIFDLKDFLFQGMVLREKEYRQDLKAYDWEKYRNKQVAITCSADAIIPVWAFMLAAAYLQPVVSGLMLGTERELFKSLFLKNISSIDPQQFTDKRVVIKGCGDTPIDSFAYTEITRLLLPEVKSIMYGEPCSTVPVYKKK
jgi:hypothetical protein